MHELVYGTIAEIANFGAFMQVGPTQGMIHISQTMEDYVSLSKTGTLFFLTVGVAVLAASVRFCPKANVEYFLIGSNSI